MAIDTILPTHPGDPVIDIRRVGKRYDNRPVLDGLDLEIGVGEVFALLGPNGAGKTTTVEILEGYRKPDEGEVRVLGMDPVHGGPAFRSRIGIVLQDTTAFDQSTVAETVDMFAVLYPDPLPVADAIALVDLTEQSDQLAVELSGGQRRRLEVACGLVGRPELLFLDEPTTGLDPEARRRMWKIITDVKARGTTVLLTTHYLDEAEALADRIGILLGGRLQEVADPSRIAGRSAALATVRFVIDVGAEVQTPPTDRDQLERLLGLDRGVADSISVNGEVVTIATHQPATVVAALVGRHGDLAELTVTRPSLEDVYLDLVARWQADSMEVVA